MILFFLFVIIPIVEIALLINIGGALGTPATLSIILITALIGSISLRRQGAVVWRRLSRMDVITLPDLLSHGLLLMLAGVFLITPGFLTDAVGLLLLIPPIRTAIARYLLKNASGNLSSGEYARKATSQSTSYDGEEHLKDSVSGHSAQTQQKASSPWAEGRPKRPKPRSAEDATILDKDLDRP